MIPGFQDSGRPLFKPLGYVADAGDFRPWIVLEFPIGFELRKPARHLTFQESGRLAEIGEPHRDVVDSAQSGQRIGHRQAHPEPHSGVSGVQRRQFLASVESVDGFHQVEHRVTENRRVVARRNESRVWHIAAGQRGQDPGLTQDHVVAARTQVQRSAPQHVLPAGSGEPQHDVLGAPSDRTNVVQRAFTEIVPGHPVSHRSQVFHPGEPTRLTHSFRGYCPNRLSSYAGELRMQRTDNDSWNITESVGATALGVAAARAAETERPTR